MATIKRRKKLPSRHRAKQRATDFEAGLQAAHKQIGPIIMRRYFLRGMLAGAVVLMVAVGVALLTLHLTGVAVIECITL